MDEYKKACKLYKCWLTKVEPLAPIDAGLLFKNILKYINNEPTDVPENIKSLYTEIIEQIEYEWSKFNPLTKKYHWNYKGGITPENRKIRNSAMTKWWRIDVFDRDDYTCQKCGKRGGELNAHHIKPFAQYPDKRFLLSNGITLCKPCHINEHKKEVVNG